MYINFNCSDPDEFVPGRDGSLIQKKFLRTEDSNPGSDKISYIRMLIENESMLQQLVKKADALGISPEECINRALDEFLN